jgi:hypothetical protein
VQPTQGDSLNTTLALIQEYMNRVGTDSSYTFLITYDEVSASANKLLDDYPGAAAAYSLRKLDKDYTGYAIKVRESAGNTLADIGFDSNGDLDTTALLAHTGPASGYVHTWYDQSGNGNNATQGTNANQPQIVSSGTVISRNNMPAIIDNLSGNNSLNLTYSVVDGSWIFAVGQVESSFTCFVQSETAAKFLLVAQQSVGSSPNSGVSNVITYIDGTSTALTSRNSVYTTFQQQRLLSVSFDNDTWTEFNIGYPGSGSVDMMTMQELILYPSDQSSNRTGIESNINTYYSIYP